MGVQSVYLPDVLRAAESNCVAKDLSTVIGISADAAGTLLRYWERAGLLAGTMERFARIGRRGSPYRKRYTLTQLGRERLAEIRGIRCDVYRASTDLASALGYSRRT